MKFMNVIAAAAMLFSSSAQAASFSRPSMSSSHPSVSSRPSVSYSRPSYTPSYRPTYRPTVVQRHDNFLPGVMVGSMLGSHHTTVVQQPVYAEQPMVAAPVVTHSNAASTFLILLLALAVVLGIGAVIYLVFRRNTW
jgi:hypothetical protein